MRFLESFYSRYNSGGTLVKSFLITILVFPFLFVYSILGHLILEEYFQIFIPNTIGNQSPLVNIITSILFAPIFETLIFQVFLVQVIYAIYNNTTRLKRIEARLFRNYAIILSALCFALSHYFNHAYYPILIFPLGVVLSAVFVKTYLDMGNFEAFKMTSLIHALWNLFILIGYYLTEY